MGGLYQNPKADDLLAVLGNPDVGRFRDAWVENRDGEPVIAIHCRNGGGNREHWGLTYDESEEGMTCDCPGCIQTYALPAHPLYVFDEDNDFDSTYCTTYFRVPDEHREALLAVAGDPVDVSGMWRDAIAALRNA